MIGRLGLLGVLLAATVSRAELHAQNTTLTRTGFNGNFGNSTVATFDAGFDEAGSSVTFTVAITTSAASRKTNVYISATAATIGSNPISDVLWRRNDLGVWNPLTTTPVLVESRTIAGVGTSWANGVVLRIQYPWNSTIAEGLAATVVITLEVVPP